MFYLYFKVHASMNNYNKAYGFTAAMLSHLLRAIILFPFKE